MNKGILSSVVLALVACLLVASVNAVAGGFCYMSNDFDESHWTVSSGYGIFKSSSVVMVEQSSDNKSKGTYYETFEDMDGNENSTVPTSVYARLTFDAKYHQGADGVSGIAVVFANTSSSDIILMVKVYKDGTASKFYVLTADNAGGDVVDLSYTTVESVPDAFIFFTDGEWAILYNTSGDVEASIEITNGSSYSFSTFAIEITACDDVEFTEIGVYSSLSSACSSMMALTGTFMAWMPLIVEFAMLGMVLGLLKKFGGR